MELIGKNTYRRRFAQAAGQGLLPLYPEPQSADDIAISIRGNDIGTVLWPVMQDEEAFWLLADIQSLKSEKALNLTRKNPKHLAWFNRDLFASAPVTGNNDVCIDDELRDIIKDAYVQSPTVIRVIDLQAGVRGKRLKVARLLETYQKDWRRRLSLSDKECCY